MRLKFVFVFFFCSAAVISSCQTTPSTKDSSASGGVVTEDKNAQKMNINYTSSPVRISGAEYKFARNVAYDKYSNTNFDIFLPESSSPTALVIFIHGGGFAWGDKTNVYSRDYGMLGAGGIEYFLQNRVAYATINYRLLSNYDEQGVLKCLNDTKRCLQFIRYHATELNINPENIVLAGVSAGAGSSLWLAFHDDMANSSSQDPIERQSTRVKGVVAAETQCTYDILKWQTEVFAEMGPLISLKMLEGTDMERRLMAFYGIEKFSELETPEMIAYRKKVDILSLMDKNDPEIWVQNNQGNYDYGTSANSVYQALLHHPLHAKVLKDKADLVGMKGKFYIPALNISDPGNEPLEEFVLRKLRE